LPEYERRVVGFFAKALLERIYTLARRMGTSVAMIDKTYGHLAPDADDAERGLLNEYDAGQAKGDETTDEPVAVRAP
jgi:hypothetical protein